ncbi:MAG: dihydropteroate synthase [Bacteroidetes bacterium B1(2017)]|nr:MAG: dihydropteroate synthase [Bacteroidetes bacterium B1(2017)]
MGILNTTPDSFFEGSRIDGPNKLLLKVENMLQSGATFIDIGGQSTRPGALLISAEEELKRVVPAIDEIQKEFPEAIISIDTFYASVAKAAIEAGASIINDISAGDDDPAMFDVLGSLKVPYIMMHKKGLPKSMQENPQYGDLVLEIASYFSKKLEQLRALGIADVILDPGFGFGKNLQHNYQLLNQLNHFKIFELPLLVGVSRKSMIQKVLEVDANAALNGTTAVHMASLMNGATILRAHDVKEAVECVKIYEAMKQ